jgi:hypothetical protein
MIQVDDLLRCHLPGLRMHSNLVPRGDESKGTDSGVLAVDSLELAKLDAHQIRPR